MWAGKMTLIYCSLSPEELPADLSQHCNDHAEWKMDGHKCENWFWRAGFLLHMVSLYENLELPVRGFTLLRRSLRLSSALPLVYSDNHNHLLLGSVHKWRETRLRRCKARLRCCSVKPLCNKREKKPHVQMWGSGGSVLLWSMTRARMKIALCLKCMVWRLPIKTSSGVMHGGVWRPEDLLSKLCTYCRSSCTVTEIFFSESCVSWKQKQECVLFCTIMIKVSKF